MGCWSSSKGKKSKRWAAGVPARLKNQKDGLLEFQQRQKIKKTGCWNSSKGEKSKRWASGNSGARKIKKLGVGKFRSLKNQKVGRREIPQARKIKKSVVGKFRRPKKSKRWASGNSARPNRVKMARRKIPQAQTELKRGVGKFRKIEKFYLRIDFLSWRQNVNRLTLQTKK